MNAILGHILQLCVSMPRGGRDVAFEEIRKSLFSKDLVAAGTGLRQAAYTQLQDASG